ncbi:MAG: cytochrome c-type biogenesis protein [Halocynthiibacter sp.]
MIIVKRVFLILLLLTGPALAVQPDEILDDPKLEARARELSKGLRCLVCRNENIDDSNAELARDLRLLVRERLVAGDSDEEAVQYLVDRFGEYVLLNPKATGGNIVLWLIGPVSLLLALFGAVLYVRGRTRKSEVEATPLSPEEEAKLRDILDK